MDEAKVGDGDAPVTYHHLACRRGRCYDKQVSSSYDPNTGTVVVRIMRVQAVFGDAGDLPVRITVPRAAFPVEVALDRRVAQLRAEYDAHCERELAMVARGRELQVQLDAAMYDERKAAEKAAEGTK